MPSRSRSLADLAHEIALARLQALNARCRVMRLFFRADQLKLRYTDGKLPVFEVTL